MEPEYGSIQLLRLTDESECGRSQYDPEDGNIQLEGQADEAECGSGCFVSQHDPECDKIKLEGQTGEPKPECGSGSGSDKHLKLIELADIPECGSALPMTKLKKETTERKKNSTKNGKNLPRMKVDIFV